MSVRFTMPLQQWMSSLGVPGAGYKLYFYTTGTSTPLNTYSDDGLTVPNANPVIADATGTWGPIFLQALDYKVVLTTASGAQISSADPVHGNPTFAGVSAKDYGAVGDGVADDTAALQAWLTAIGTGYYATTIAGPGIGFLPAGKYKHTATLTIPANAYVYGVPWKSTLRPTSAVTTAAVIQAAGSTLRGIVIDGINAGNISGLSIGASGLTNNGATYQVVSVRFTSGAASYALNVARAVIWTFTDCYFGDSTYGANILDSGNGSPTTLAFTNCLFKGNSQVGLQMFTGQECQFIGCIFEQNGSLGSYCNVAGGGGGFAVVQNILFQGCYWESNQTSLASGAARHAAYHAYARGDDIKFRDCFFANGTGHASFLTEARALQLDNANEYLVDHCDVAIEAGQISLISGSQGTFVNWIDLCGDPLVTVSDATTFGNTRIIYEKHGVWTPVLTFAASGDLAVGYAANGQQGRYIRQGNRYTLTGFLDVSTFTFTTATGNLRVTGLPLPAKTVTGFEWTGECNSFQGITKANYTSIAAKIASGNSYIEFDISGSAQALATVAFGDVPTGTAKKLKFTVTYEV